MSIKTNNQLRYLFISGLLFLALYFFYNLAYKIWSIFAFVLLVLLGFIILIVTVQAFLRNNRVAQCVGLMMIGVVAVNEILKSELLKSEKILEASLIDDVSSIHLILRKNREFEIISKYYFGPDEIFQGEYEIQDSKIIFLDPPYDNDFIPDTVFIDGDKIYMGLNRQGEPDFSFASYFQVTRNQVRNATQH